MSKRSVSGLRRNVAPSFWSKRWKARPAFRPSMGVCSHSWIPRGFSASLRRSSASETPADPKCRHKGPHQGPTAFGKKLRGNIVGNGKNFLGAVPPARERAHPSVCRPEAIKTLGSSGQGLLANLVSSTKTRCPIAGCPSKGITSSRLKST